MNEKQELLPLGATDTLIVPFPLPNPLELIDFIASSLRFAIGDCVPIMSTFSCSFL